MRFAGWQRDYLQQPNLFSPETPHGLPSKAEPAGVAQQGAHSTPPAAAAGRDEALPLWLRRVDIFLRVVVRLYLGLLLIALPWMHFWSENHFFIVYQPLGTFAQSGAVRGVISGLGLLNIWIAISEAIHYRDRKA